MRADFIQRHQVGMVEMRRCFRLGEEAAHVGLAGKLAGEDHFERDDAIDAKLLRLVDNAHAPGAEYLENLIAGYLFTRARKLVGSIGWRRCLPPVGIFGILKVEGILTKQIAEEIRPLVQIVKEGRAGEAAARQVVRDFLDACIGHLALLERE